MDAHVTLAGNVGNDIDYRSATRDQDAWASFRLGHNPGYRKEGEWVNLATVWVTVNCRRMLARNINDCMRKGDAVLVSGKLRTRLWTDAEGKERESLVLDADSIGHDLNRGTARFTRNSSALRTGSADEDPWEAEQTSDPEASDDAGTASDEEAELAVAG